MPWVTNDLTGLTEERYKDFSDKMHVTFGPEADGKLVSEIMPYIQELKEQTDKMHDEMIRVQSACEGTGLVAVPVEQLAEIYEALKRVSALGKFEILDVISDIQNPELSQLKRQLFRLTEFPALFAGQWLPREIQDEIRKKLKAECTL